LGASLSIMSTFSYSTIKKSLKPENNFSRKQYPNGQLSFLLMKTA